MTEFWRSMPDGVAVLIRVQPKSRRPGVQGRAPSADGPRLRIGVTEAAEGGRANQAVTTLLADLLSVPRSAITITHGQTNREKQVRVAGDPTTLAARLEAL